ncbi:hypothetical protein JKP88DRAFT_280712 [Tribonema minus]|uniref:Uncharacterized protein n=1 Tax=Tribonema minus TaxID=303371 RepID=A0A836CBH3_9STRA|nr:hypothetical protein JKP88DRAFT_280712 [Tribonema minus]
MATVTKQRDVHLACTRGGLSGAPPPSVTVSYSAEVTMLATEGNPNAIVFNFTSEAALGLMILMEHDPVHWLNLVTTDASVFKVPGSYLTGKTNALDTDGYAAGVGEDAKILIELSISLARELAERVMAYTRGARMLGCVAAPVSKLLGHSAD